MDDLLTDDERNWAMAIQKAVQDADPEFAKTITDLEYAQQAFVAKDKLSKALRRVRRLRDFKKEYGITNDLTAEDAIQAVKELDRLCPGLLQGFGKDEKNDRYVATWNFNCFLPVATPEEWRSCMLGLYFLMEAMNPDVASTREGIAVLADCEGLGWKNFSLEIEKRAAKLYQDAYPVRVKEITMIKAPAIFRVIYSLCKPFLSAHVREICRMDGTIVELRDRFPPEVLPTSLGGTQVVLDMEKNVEEAIRRRFENKKNFIL